MTIKNLRIIGKNTYKALQRHNKKAENGVDPKITERILEEEAKYSVLVENPEDSISDGYML